MTRSLINDFQQLLLLFLLEHLLPASDSDVGGQGGNQAVLSLVQELSQSLAIITFRYN